MKMKKLFSLYLCTVMALCLFPFSSGAESVYEETDCDKVTVYVTLSDCGLPLLGNDEDGTVLACLPVTVPYFDLQLYGLSDYYRYEAGSDGSYTGRRVIERPTALHLFIYLLERYYLGLDENQCCKGSSKLLDHKGAVSVDYFNGTNAYTGGTEHSALETEGSAKSLYMKTFWGHNENLMYYVNHQFPLMTDAVGATCDYILLSDGDTVDISMFSDPDFRFSGAFTYFDSTEYIQGTGETVTASLLSSSTMAMGDGTGNDNASLGEMTAELYNADWEKVNVPIKAGGNSLSFSLDETGVYYLLATQKSAGTYSASYAPAAAIVKTGSALMLMTDKTSIYSGDEVSVTINLENDINDVLSFDVQLRYDKDMFTPVESEAGSSNADIKISRVKSDEKGDYLSVSYVDRSSQGGNLSKGKAATVKFKAVADIAADSVGNFTLVNEGVYGKDFREIPVKLPDGISVKVIKEMPVGIIIDKLPTKLDYKYRERLNTSGMELSLVYNSGETEKITSGYTCSPQSFVVSDGLPLFGLRGTVPVKVTYGDFSAEFSVNVKLTFVQWLIKILLFGWLWY